MSNFGNSPPPSSPLVHLCPSITSIATSDDRVSALYSPFRPRELNPESYDLKMKFWTKTLQEFASLGSRVSFTLTELQKGLGIPGKNHQTKTPACLEEVLQHCAQNGSILPQKEFYDTLAASQSWASWSQVNAKRLLNKLLIPLPSPPWTWFYRTSSTPQIRYVHIEHLTGVVDSLETVPDLKNRLLGLDSFKVLITSSTGIRDPGDISILLDYLRSRKFIQLDKVGSEDVVLFGDAGLKAITDVDKGRYDVARFIEINEAQLEATHKAMEERVENAKKALKAGRRATAKHELKRKKLLEARADKLLNVLDSLTVISMRLEEAESDAKILQAYKSGKAALSDVLKKNNLTTDSVTEAMLDVQEVLEDSAEISAAISQPIDQDPEFAELDAELDALLSQDAADLAAEKERAAQELARLKEDQMLAMLKGMKVRGGEEDLDDPFGLSLDGSGDENVPSPTSHN